MSLQEYTTEYTKQLSDEKQKFRDLFGSEEYNIARRTYFGGNTTNETFLQFLRKEAERKLREQDGD